MEYQAYVRGLEAVRRTKSDGVEYWMARDLHPLLGYGSWDKFEGVIQRAMDAAKSGCLVVANHFSQTGNMVEIGSGAKRQKADWFLSRGACYLIAMNANPAKEQVGHAMIYFAAQARRQELQDKAIEQSERFAKRLELLENNRRLSGAAKARGVVRYGLFKNQGYQGLYGMGLSQVKRYKKIPEKEDLLDCVGRVELSANDLVTTLAEFRLHSENIRGEEAALAVHRKIGADVRRAVVSENGIEPRDLPTSPSIKALVQKHRRELKKAAGVDQVA